MIKFASIVCIADTSRHYLPVDVIKQVIDSMSFAKLVILLSFGLCSVLVMLPELSMYWKLELCPVERSSLAYHRWTILPLGGSIISKPLERFILQMGALHRGRCSWYCQVCYSIIWLWHFPHPLYCKMYFFSYFFSWLMFSDHFFCNMSSHTSPRKATLKKEVLLV